VRKVCVTSFSKFFIINVFIETLRLNIVRNTSKRKNIIFDKDRIIPNQLLRRYMCEKLQLENKKAQATVGGKDLSKEDLKRLEAIRNDKKRILENVIFPSMANLIFFFESIDMDPILWETFKDDVEELLGIKRKGPSPTNYGLFFVRLFTSILSTNSEYDKSDFRLRLMHEAHRCISSKMMLKIIPAIFQKMRARSYAIRYVDHDMGRALAWTEMISKDVEDPYQYSILYESEDMAKQRDKFIKQANIQKPSKTLDIDTKGILKRGY
ncbi:MAG: hypothetical protein WBN72_08325, partial [Nitrososphaeraceae archaeon]